MRSLLNSDNSYRLAKNKAIPGVQNVCAAHFYLSPWPQLPASDSVHALPQHPSQLHSAFRCLPGTSSSLCSTILPCPQGLKLWPSSPPSLSPPTPSHSGQHLLTNASICLFLWACLFVLVPLPHKAPSVQTCLCIPSATQSSTSHRTLQLSRCCWCAVCSSSV